MFRRAALSTLIVGVVAVSACTGSSAGSDSSPEESADAPAATDELLEPTEPDSSEPVDPEVTAATEDGGQQVDSQDLELFPSEAVDDVPFCQAYAEYFEVFVGIAFAASFAGFEPGGENDFQPELLEVFLYPAVLDDIVVIRETASPEVLDFFEPLFVRAERAEPALLGAGFTPEEVDRIRSADASAADADDVASDFEDDPRIDAAVDAFVAENGSLVDALDVLDAERVDDPNAEVADAFFLETCPDLSAALEEL